MTIAALIATLLTAIAMPSAARSFSPRPIAARRRDALLRDLRRLGIYFGLDDYALHAAQEAAFLEENVIGELEALHAECLGGAVERLLQIFSFESLRHRQSFHQAVCSSAG